MTEPNTALRAVRAALHMSQDELARAVRAAGDQAGEPNECSKRLVQRWEAGLVATPRGIYVRALEAATGQPIANLGFPADERYGLNRGAALGMRDDTLPEAVEIPGGPLTGIWLSRYEYVSSGRGDQTFTSAHYVVILHRGQRVQIRSLPETAAGRVIMDLTANGQVITGTWTEQTNPNGYYQGSVYHGAIQMLLELTGHRMAGKWVGFGRDWELNTGPWTLELVTADTSPESLARYNRPVEPG
jgi:transcriptional regulator with XRE-family HTH domain